MPPAHIDEGFEALLKPFQDITRNWDVNLCQYLEEYLSHIRIEVGRNVLSMNFAEAAYLLQNSANIYSKKVDELWGIMLQLLEALRKTKNGDRVNGEVGPEGDTADPANRRKRPTATLQTEEFEFIEDICSKHSLDAKPRKTPVKPENKKKIVLNAATKGATKEGMSCKIYDEGNEVIGKKEEFRLHWRISTSGTLHEEFVNNHHKSRRREVNTDDDDGIEDPCHVSCDDLPPADDSIPPDIPLELNNDEIICNGSEDVQPPSECIVENEIDVIAQRKRDKIKDNIVSVTEIKKKVWEPTSFDIGMPDKPVRKRKILKFPEVLPDNTTSIEIRKRKRTEIKLGVSNYISFHCMLQQFIKAKNVNGYLHAQELLMIVIAEGQFRRQVMFRRRKAFQELLIKEAEKKFDEDFEGFPDMDPDSDDDGGGFQGFVDEGDDNGFSDHFNVPLPETHSDGDGRETYESEALKTLQEYKNLDQDAAEMTSLSERVSLWHQLIRPKLEIAEKRSAFRIHKYGSRILDKFPSDCDDPEGNTKTFGHIVSGLPREEVARNFLATLCLTNTYNVEIVEKDKNQMDMDCLQLKLLSRVRHHEEMHENMVQNAES